MPLDCLQIKTLVKQPRWPYSFKSFVLDKTEHMQKCRTILGNGENLLYIYFFRVFRTQVLQNYFRVFLSVLSFEIMQDIYRNLLMHHFLRSNVGTSYSYPPHKYWRIAKKLVRWPMLFFCWFIFSLEHNLCTYHQAKNWEFGISFWNSIHLLNSLDNCTSF